MEGVGWILIVAGGLFVRGFFWHGFAVVALGVVLLIADRAWPERSE